MTVFVPPQSWIGCRGEFDAPVTDADTAVAMGSGDVAVLATPRLIAWIERATVLAVAAEMTPECTSVGVLVEVAHRRPTPVGALVTTWATVTNVDAGRITFEVGADHVVPSGERIEGIGRGTIVRAVVERASFGL
ncbi:MAG: thioesterase [Actinomycetales bacterium]|nr:thioesterase [Actinomycetales bacterium]MCP4892606.1 thioesterase [Actinomycetales bacterium]